MTAPTPRPLARTEVAKPDEDRPDTPARWNAAYQRALDNGLMIRPGMFGVGLWTVTSMSRPDLVYAVDATRCGCFAAEFGKDPVCMHRSLYRAVLGIAPFAQANVIPFPVRTEPETAA